MLMSVHTIPPLWKIYDQHTKKSATDLLETVKINHPNLSGNVSINLCMIRDLER